MSVREVAASFKTSDGKEFADKKAAERHQALLAAQREMEGAQYRFGLLLAECACTADGSLFRFGACRGYWHVQEYAGVPMLRQVDFSPRFCKVELEDEGPVIFLRERSSGGWCFLLRIYPPGVGADPTEAILDLPDWERVSSQPDAVIMNEYGDTLSPQAMREVITNRDARPWPERKSTWGYASWQDFHRHNHSEEGPNGLLRHRLGDFCCGHGAGTWDLTDREFS